MQDRLQIYVTTVSTLFSQNLPDAEQQLSFLWYVLCIFPGTIDKSQRQAWDGHNNIPARTEPDF
jgi:hypothetical protein